jgi:hypothetical protein
MPDTNVATGIVIVAGTVTFGNEWYQTKEVNWKIPLATILIALGIDGLSHLDSNAATGLAILVLIGAVTTKFNGQSVANVIYNTFSQHAPERTNHHG